MNDKPTSLGRKTKGAVAVAGAFNPALRSFKNFAYYLWQELGLPPPTEVQYDIATFLQQGPRRRMVEAFRGVGKSWLTAAYVLYRFLLNPDERIMVVSASKDRADAFAVFVKRLIDQVEWLHHLRPDPALGHRDSVVAFDVGTSSAHQAPSLRSVGITGQMTGGRASLIVADDIETPKNSLTMLQRERIGELVKEFDAVLIPEGEIIYLGTPQCEDSLYNKLPERGYEIRIWPARKPKEEWMTAYGHMLTPFMRDRLEAMTSERDSSDPIRFSADDLEERELSYGKSGFALQFMLDTKLSDADRYPLKLGDLIVHSVSSMAPLKIVWSGHPDQTVNDLPVVGMKGDRLRRPVFTHQDHVEFSGAVMFVDPSGRGADETSYAVVKISNSMLYLTASGGFKDGYDDEVLKELAKVAKTHQVNHVIAEPNFGDGMFTKMLSPFLREIHPCSVEDAPRASVQKEKRMLDILEPILNQHRLVIDDRVVRADFLVDDPHRQLLYQLTRLTREKGALRYDDRLDALTGAVAYWVEQLARSQDEAVVKASTKKVDEELKRFKKHVVGARQETRGWAI